MELNSESSRKFGYVQRSVKIGSMSENDADIAEICYDVSLCQGSLQNVVKSLRNGAKRSGKS